MTATLRQLTLTFDPKEDRMLLRIGTGENTEYQLWLTRRFIRITWTALMKSLDQMLDVIEPAGQLSDPSLKDDDGKSKLDSEAGAGKDKTKNDNQKIANDSGGTKISQAVREKVKAVEHREAIQASDFGQKHAKGNVNLTSKSGPLLVVGCRVKSLDENNTILSLKTSDGTGIQFGLNKKLLHALCHMMISSTEKAQWDLDLFVGNPQAFTPDVPEGVIH